MMKPVYFLKLQKNPHCIHLFNVLIPSQYADICQKLRSLLKWENLSYLRRSTTWSMSVMFNLSLTASISSAAVARSEHRDHNLGERVTKPETESCDARNRVNTSFSRLPCLVHSIFGVEPVTVTQDVVDNLRFVARHQLVSRTVSTRQETRKHRLKIWNFKLACCFESAKCNRQWSEQCTFNITTIT